MVAPTDMKLLKVISLLMDYPSKELFEGTTFADCEQIIRTSPLISPEIRRDIIALIHDIQAMGEMEAGARYDGLFERGRSLSLWLFEHVHGESRDRGQAMVDLMAQYEQAGFEIGVKELPDYLPMYLEFLAYQAVATGDIPQIREDLADISHILVVLSARLIDKNSPYVSLFKALLQIAGEPFELIDEELEKMHQAQAKTIAPAEDSTEAIDKEWEEEMVDFLGAEQENCASNQTKKHVATTLASQAQQSIDVPVHWVDFSTQSATHSANGINKENLSTLSTIPQGASL